MHVDVGGLQFDAGHGLCIDLQLARGVVGDIRKTLAHLVGLRFTGRNDHRTVTFAVQPLIQGQRIVDGRALDLGGHLEVHRRFAVRFTRRECGVVMHLHDDQRSGPHQHAGILGERQAVHARRPVGQPVGIVEQLLEGAGEARFDVVPDRFVTEAIGERTTETLVARSVFLLAQYSQQVRAFRSDGMGDEVMRDTQVAGVRHEAGDIGVGVVRPLDDEATIVVLAILVRQVGFPGQHLHGQVGVKDELLGMAGIRHRRTGLRKAGSGPVGEHLFLVGRQRKVVHIVLVAGLGQPGWHAVVRDGVRDGHPERVGLFGVLEGERHAVIRVTGDAVRFDQRHDVLVKLDICGSRQGCPGDQRHRDNCICRLHKFTPSCGAVSPTCAWPQPNPEDRPH